MKLFNLTSFLFLLSITAGPGIITAAHAQAVKPSNQQLINHQDWSFVENKGQLADASGQTHADIKYYSHDGGPEIYCRPGKISFVFKKFTDAKGQDIDLMEPPKSPQNALDKRREMEDMVTNKKLIVVTSRTDLVLANADMNALITGADQQASYENYYTSYTPESGVNKVHTFKTIVYQNIYPNIDMQLHARNGAVEYEFIVHPGGKVSDIQMQWNGLQHMESLTNGGMHYTGQMIDMTDSKPVSFLKAGTVIASNFVKNNNTISFGVSEYDHSQTLTIDPTLSWGTYLGGGSRNYGEAVWTDNAGNVLMCGPSTSPTTNISTSGAFQTSYSTYDAFLAKFSSTGGLQWCTYYGGSGYNDGWGLSNDKLGNIYMTGATSSSSGIATSGSYQSLIGGSGSASYNGYAVKFRPDGSRVWGTYYGGTANDQSLFLCTDTAANVFITAWVTSTSGIATSGAYQTSYAGNQDAGLAKYDSAGNLKWSTYYGGSGSEGSNNLATDLNGNVIMVGGTNSSSAVATPGSFQSSFGGNEDGFVASFSSSGSLNWATYLGGTGYEFAWGDVTDQFGNIYVNGQTASKLVLASNIPYQNDLAGSANSFLSKFLPNGTMVWSTYYGGGGTDIGYNLATDPTGSIFVTGQTNSNYGIATPKAYLTSLAGTDNAFFSKFSPSGNLMYGSYYGGSGTDISYDIHADTKGNTYFSGQTSSTSGIATSGGYMSSYSSASVDAFLASFYFPSVANDAGIAMMASPSGYCAGTTTIQVLLENFGTKNLTTATIGWTLNGKAKTPISWKGSLGPDSVVAVTLGTFTFAGGVDTFKVWTSKPNGVVDSMPGNDTMKSKVIFVAYPKVDAGGPKTVCAGSSVLLGPSNVPKGVSFSWTSDSGKFSSNAANPTVSPKVTTKYILTETTYAGGCSAKDSAIVTVGQIPTPKSGGKDTICYGASFTLGLKPFPGHLYSWSSVPGNFASAVSNPTVSPKVNTVYYETEIDSATGCLGYGHTTIYVNPEARANGGGNQKICPNGSAAIGSSSVSGHNYSWTSAPAGFTSTKSNPTVSPSTATTYYFSDQTTSTGCIAGDTVTVSFNPLPAAATGPNQTVCAGINLPLGAKAVTGDTYSWKTKPAGFTSTLSNPTVIPSGTTDYILTETITATGCSKTDTVIISTNPQPVAYNGGTQNVCLGNIVQLGNGNTSGHTYSWSSVPKGFSSSNGYPTVSPTATTKYYLVETITATRCSRKDSVTVVVNSVTANAGTSKAICQGVADTLGTKAVTGKSYSWTSNPAGFLNASSNPVVSPAKTTIYYLQVTDNASNCIAHDTVVIYVYPLPPALTGPAKSICSGTTINIGDTSSAPDSFSWVSIPPGFTSNSDNPQISPTQTTVYYLTETNNTTGCFKTNSVKITTLSLPDSKWKPTFSGKTTSLHAQDSSLNYNKYYWNLGDGDTASGHTARHIYAHNTTYSVKLTVTGTNGCTSAFDSTIKVTVSGIETSQANDLNLELFPNPFSTTTTLQYHLNAANKIRIVLSDLTGRQIAVIADENDVAGNYKVEIDASKYHLSPGMYLLQFIKDNQFVTKHLIKM